MKNILSFLGKVLVGILAAFLIILGALQVLKSCPRQFGGNP